MQDNETDKIEEYIMKFIRVAYAAVAVLSVFKSENSAHTFFEFNTNFGALTQTEKHLVIFPKQHADHRTLLRNLYEYQNI